MFHLKLFGYLRYHTHALSVLQLKKHVSASSLKMSTTSEKPACIFCVIAAKGDEKTEILYEDSKYVAFRDLKPATDRHLLIVPKRHITNASSIAPQEAEIVNELVQAGTNILSRDGIDPADPEVRMGFHWPPFNMIHHLHLHVLYPVSKLGFLSRIFYRPDSWWFVSPTTALQELAKKSR